MCCEQVLKAGIWIAIGGRGLSCGYYSLNFTSFRIQSRLYLHQSGEDQGAEPGNFGKRCLSNLDLGALEECRRLDKQGYSFAGYWRRVWAWSCYEQVVDYLPASL